MTNKELAKYYRKGCGDECHVCAHRPLTGDMTDYNGEIRCWVCGTTYQTLGSHLTQEFLDQIGLKKEQVANRYCDCIEYVPLLIDYWNKVGIKIPLGTFLMGDGGITAIEKESFTRFLHQNADKYRDVFPNDFNWDYIAKWEDPVVCAGI